MTDKKSITQSEFVFSIEKTRNTPYVLLDANKGIIKISGSASFENTDDFFKPILEFIDKHFNKPDSITIEITLEYFNSSSSKNILAIFRTLNNLFQGGKIVMGKWYYDEDDEEVMNEGEYLQDLVKFPIELIEIVED